MKTEKKVAVKVDKIAALDAAIERAKAKAKEVPAKEPAKAKEAAPVPKPLDLFKWEGVTLVKGQPYYLVRAKSPEASGAFEAPTEVVTARFVKALGEKAYAFDDGRLAEELIFLEVEVEDREVEVFPHTAAGKKSAEGKVSSDTDLREKTIALAKSGTEEELLDLPGYSLNVCAVALGKTAKDLVAVGKSKAKKVAFLLKARG